jgi:hypothetical protein
MKSIIGLILVVLGVIAGLYAGIFLCFIGGIIQVIEAIKISPISSTEIAFGIARVLFAGLIGWITAIIFIIPGSLLIKDY